MNQRRAGECLRGNLQAIILVHRALYGRIAGASLNREFLEDAASTLEGQAHSLREWSQMFPASPKGEVEKP